MLEQPIKGMEFHDKDKGKKKKLIRKKPKIKGVYKL